MVYKCVERERERERRSLLEAPWEPAWCFITGLLDEVVLMKKCCDKNSNLNGKSFAAMTCSSPSKIQKNDDERHVDIHV